MTKFQTPRTRSILVPTDFSTGAQNAIDYAVQFTAITGGRINLYHAVHIPVLTSNEMVSLAGSEELEKASLKRMDEIIKEIKVRYQFNDLDRLISNGFAVDEITSIVKEKNYDLVVMGTKGASGLPEVLVGSNTAEVIERCSCPVLAIPSEARYQPVKRAVFATNYADNDFQTLYVLAELLKPFNAEITVLHIEDQHDHQLENSLLEWFKGQVRTNITYDKFQFNLVHGKNIMQSLNDFLDQYPADLLAISTRKRNFFDKLTSHSLTRKLACHTRIPLLAFHAFNKSSTPVF